jgi:vacuolar protein sorting-associated protein 35
MGEWGLAWWLFRDEAGLLRREDFAGQFDGSAYYRLAQRNGVRYFPRAGTEGSRQQALAPGLALKKLE